MSIYPILKFDDVDLESLLRDKVKHIIDSLSSYSVFREKSEVDIMLRIMKTIEEE